MVDEKPRLSDFLGQPRRSLVWIGALQMAGFTGSEIDRLLPPTKKETKNDGQ